MSPSAKLLRLIVAELESKATIEELSVKIRNKEVGILANEEKETTVGAWLRDESSNRQFSALLALLSYLPLETLTKVFAKVLPEAPYSIKDALEKYKRLKRAEKKTKRKSVQIGQKEKPIDSQSRLN